MKLEDTVLREIRTNIVTFRLPEVPRVVRLVETESIDRMMSTSGCGEEEMWSYCLVGTEVQCGKTKKFWRWMVVMAVQQCECT